MRNQKLYRMPCMEKMAEQPDKSFDLGSADPPYFKGLGKNGSYRSAAGQLVKRKRTYKNPCAQWDNEIPTEEFFIELQRISYDQIIWGANYFDFIGPVHKTPRRGKEFDDWLLSHPTGWIVWDKCNGASDFNDYELAWTSFDMPTIVFKFLWNGMIQGKSLKEPTVQQGNKKLNQKRIHPTQKPVQLYQFLFTLRKFKSIFETHAGSFSAGIAAFDLSIPMVACELKYSYYMDAKKRYKNHTKQLSLL